MHVKRERERERLAEEEKEGESEKKGAREKEPRAEKREFYEMYPPMSGAVCASVRVT